MDDNSSGTFNILLLVLPLDVVVFNGISCYSYVLSCSYISYLKVAKFPFQKII